MQTNNKQLNLEDVVATASLYLHKDGANVHRILKHIQSHGMQSTMIFETKQEDSLYWLLGQKIAENKWDISLIDPKSNFRSKMSEKTDEEFISLVNYIDATAKAILTVEALDIVPIKPENIDFKFNLLSKKVGKKMNKFWPFV